MSPANLNAELEFEGAKWGERGRGVMDYNESEGGEGGRGRKGLNKYALNANLEWYSGRARG